MNNNNTLLKGLIMTFVSIIASMVASGFPTTNIGWEVSGLTILGSLLGYLAQNAVLPPSVSLFGTLNLGADIIKGLLVGLGGLLSSLTANGLTGTKNDWGVIGKLVLTLVVGYLAKQLSTNSLGQPLQSETVK